jgi:hypothetical protein
MEVDIKESMEVDIKESMEVDIKESSTFLYLHVAMNASCSSQSSLHKLFE